MRFLETFRGRLLIVLAILLVVTLGAQYYVNLRVQMENGEIRERQEQALVAGISLGFNGMQSTDRLSDFLYRGGQPFFEENLRSRISDIIIIGPEWFVYDSLDPNLTPKVNADGVITYRQLSELTWLPPPMEGNRLGDDIRRFPNSGGAADDAFEGEAHAVPIETTQGRFYVMVILRDDRAEAEARAARPLVYTLLILSVSTIVTMFLVWRFTGPIAKLSGAARRVAQGDLSVRLKESGSDEIGKLAAQFDEMTAELERKKELEAKLIEAEKSAVVGRLGASIAHEIRNPLNYINLSLDHMAVKYPPSDEKGREEFAEIAAQIKAEVRRIEARVGELLDYARAPKPELAPMNVRTAIDDALKIVEAEAAERKVRIGIQEAGGTPLVVADREYLRSLFSNLFINAVKAMETSGGTLSIKIEPEGEFVSVNVSDTGEGIAALDIAHIFEPYYSGRKTGTGLGLAIAQRIVEVHHGTISVDSEVGKGTKFTVRLPTAP